MIHTSIAFTLLGASYAIVAPRARPCEPLKHSVAPEPNPNTVESFSTYPFYSDISKVIAAPKGYQVASTDGNASVRSSKYMHYVELDSYDAESCAQHCDNSRGCKSFNIYFQRNPAVEPGVGCANPEAHPLVMCGLYNHVVDSSEALNYGQTRGPIDANGQAFQVVIRGSNIYNKVPSSSSQEAVTVTITAPCTEELPTSTAATPSQISSSDAPSFRSSSSMRISRTTIYPSGFSKSSSASSSTKRSTSSFIRSSASPISSSSTRSSTRSSVSSSAVTPPSSSSRMAASSSVVSIQTVVVTSPATSVQTVVVTSSATSVQTVVVTSVIPNVQTVTSVVPNVQTVTSVVPNVQTVTSVVPNVQTVTSVVPNVQTVTSVVPSVQTVTLTVIVSNTSVAPSPIASSSPSSLRISWTTIYPPGFFSTSTKRSGTTVLVPISKLKTSSSTRMTATPTKRLRTTTAAF